jgi:pimeloyl-ACP methyl ester carboxylesterase
MRDDVIVRIGGLAAHTIGDGPPVVLVHGWAGLKEGWMRLPFALADAGYQAVMIDLPGWGDSPAPSGFPHTPEAYGVALGRVLDQLGPTPVIAHSMGAQGACLLALHRPRALTKLVMLAPAVVPFREIEFPPQSMRDVVRYPVVGVPLTRIALLWLRRDPERWRGQFLRAFHEPDRFEGDHDLERTLDYVCKKMTRTATSTLASSAPDLLGFDARPLAPRLPQDALVVYGERDRVTRPEGAQEVAALMPNAQAMSVPDVAHFPHVEAVDTVLPAIVEYLAA